MVTYPLVDLFDVCKVSDTTFWPIHRQELSRVAGGATQAKDLGSALWGASFTTAPQRRADAADIEAALISLNGSVGSFLAYDHRRPFPRDYPTGVFGDGGVISTLYTSNAFDLRISGLDPDFQLRRGDYLAFEYGTRPSRALHMVMGDVKANNAGLTGRFSVYPAIREGALVGASVTLKRPSCEMILDLKQSPPSLSGLVASVVTFTGVQIL